jgi:membrane associated rhomboid family serine protease
MPYSARVIPLRDINPTSTWPFVNYALIALNAVVFGYELMLEPAAVNHLVLDYGFVPVIARESMLEGLLRAGSSMFMHGGFMHFASNMWFLYIFGDNVEDVLVHQRYITFYVVCGLAGALSQFMVDPASPVPMVGASGAIAGVLGAYYRLFPHARVVALIPIFIFIMVRELPAVFFLVLWFLLQLVQGVGSLAVQTTGGGVAFFAHIGGFVAGLAFVLVSRHKPRKRARQSDGWTRR